MEEHTVLIIIIAASFALLIYLIVKDDFKVKNKKTNENKKEKK